MPVNFLDYILGGATGGVEGYRAGQERARIADEAERQRKRQEAADAQARMLFELGMQEKGYSKTPAIPTTLPNLGDPSGYIGSSALKALATAQPMQTKVGDFYKVGPSEEDRRYQRGLDEKKAEHQRGLDEKLADDKKQFDRKNAGDFATLSEKGGPLAGKKRTDVDPSTGTPYAEMDLSEPAKFYLERVKGELDIRQAGVNRRTAQDTTSTNTLRALSDAAKETAAGQREYNAMLKRKPKAGDFPLVSESGQTQGEQMQAAMPNWRADSTNVANALKSAQDTEAGVRAYARQNVSGFGGGATTPSGGGMKEQELAQRAASAIQTQMKNPDVNRRNAAIAAINAELERQIRQLRGR
jgi:hypothetical protein